MADLHDRVRAEVLALSVRQPWAWAILHAGKDVENRTWAPPDWLWGRRILIHASKVVDDEGTATLSYLAEEWGFRPPPTECPTGAIVGSVVVLGCSRLMHSRWHRPGAVGWSLAAPRDLSMPVPCRGRLGLWRVPAHIANACAEVLDAA